jgi:toxin ParE1/3/4
MPAFRLTVKARADLTNAGRYTQKTWGRDQRNCHPSRLDEVFHLLARERDRGHPCDDIGQGYRQYHPGRPVILYRQSSQDIEIIRILHERMDIEVRLSE